jgi:PadR family transcriptional regulator, regulatory protein PadR
MYDDLKPENIPIPQNHSVNFFSTFEEIILIALSHHELYGLQIVNAVKDVSGGSRTISLGTLYPILGRLEKQELISSRLHNGSTLSKGGARRKFFKITEAGSHSLSEIQNFRNGLHQWRPSYGETAYT